MNRKPHHARCSGLTLIELITALALFVLIFALLMAVLRSASRLWSPDQSDTQLQTRGDTVMDILANDFYQAIADNGVVYGKTNEPSFMLDCNTNNLSISTSEPTIVLYFARHASSKITSGTPSERLSLDAVFYVLWENRLSRHSYPLTRDWTDDTKTLGVLLLEARDMLADEIEAAYAWFEGGSAFPSQGQHSLLAERCEFAAVAALPPAALKNVLVADDPLVILDECEAYAVPDFLDVALMLYDEADWRIFQSQTAVPTPEEAMRLEHLGKPFSKRITYPAKGGSRL